MCRQTLDGVDIFVDASSSFHFYKLPILFGSGATSVRHPVII